MSFLNLFKSQFFKLPPKGRFYEGREFCNWLYIFCIFFLCCSAQDQDDDWYKLPSDFVLKEMKTELLEAQRQMALQKEYVEQLEQAIAHKEIEYIRKDLNGLKEEEMTKNDLQSQHWFCFFDQQRETLGQIIRKYPQCRPEAQEVLDQILALITTLSDTIVD